MDHYGNSISDIECKDINVELRCYDYESDRSTVLILNLDEIHDVLGHLVDWLAGLVDDLKFSGLDLSCSTFGLR